MRRTRLSTHSSALHVATRSCCAVLLLGSVSLAWGRPPQDSLPGLETKNENTAMVVRDFTTAIDTMTQAEVVQDYTLQSSAIAQLPEEQPGIVATFHFVDPRALGEFFVQCYDAGLAVRMLDLGPPAPKSGRRTGHASVHGVNSVSMDFLLKSGVPGLDLTLYTVDGKGFPGARLPRNPLATRVDRMQQELTELQDQIAKLEALRAEFRGRRAGVSYPRDPASGLPPARDRLLLDPATGNLIEQGRLLVDPASGLPGERNRLVLEPVSGNPVTIQGVVVNTLGGDQSLIAISIGSNQGVVVGTLFEVFRDSTYKGRVKIVTVSEDLCIGTIELQAEGTKIEQGDKATTRL